MKETESQLSKRTLPRAKPTIAGDYFISTMPIKNLVAGLENVPDEVRSVADGLLYRDFLTVGLLLKKMKIRNNLPRKSLNENPLDNWIYIQEKKVKLGRLQIFNNWSPYMVRDVNTVWVGLEYFCSEGDKLWSMKDNDLIDFAANELASIDIIEREDVLDGVVIRVPKAYPAYFGSYERLD